MAASDLVTGADGFRGDYTLDRHEVVRRNAWRAFLTPTLIALGLLALQLPPYYVANGTWSGVPDDVQEASARLSLVLDTAFVLTLALAARRAVRFVEATRVGQGRRRLARGGSYLLLAGLVLDLVENVVITRQFESRFPGRSGMVVEGWWEQGGPLWSFTAVKLLVLLLGAFVLLGAVLTSWRQRPPPAPDADHGRQAADAGILEQAGTVICCSGGGIRAAAFSMGGLQALSAAGVYQGASAVVGVSGGGYTAAAHHVLRWSPADESVKGRASGVRLAEADPEWPDADDEGKKLFALDSPELGWVRRHTRYLVGSFGVAVQGVLALAFGIAVNFLLVGSLLLVSSWTLAWYLLSKQTATAAPQWWVDAVGWLPWALLATAALSYLLPRFWERWRVIPEKGRAVLEQLTAVLLPVAVIAVVALVGVPALLAELQDESPFGLGETWTDLIRTLLPESETGATGAGAGSLVAAILAVLASLSGKPEEEGARWWASLWSKVKRVVVPWLAAVVVVGVLAVLLVRWTAQALDQPGWLADPWLVGILGGLLLAARVLTDANRTSLHHFFRGRISRAFLLRRSKRRLGTVPYRRPLRYSEAAPRQRHLELPVGPALVTCAVANVTDDDLVPADRDCVPFVFSHDLIGLTDRMLPPRASLLPSAAYERAADPWYRDATIPAALAMSAAAFSPLAGRENKLIGPYRLVLALGNARLGVWLPNPLHVDAATTLRALVGSGDIEDVVEAARLLARFGHRRVGGQVITWSMHGVPDTLARCLGSVAEKMRHAEEAEAKCAEARGEAVKAEHERDQAARDQGELASQGGSLCDRRQSRRIRQAKDAALLARNEELASREAEADVAHTAVHEAAACLARGRSSWWRRAGSSGGLRKPGLTRVFKEAIGKASIYDRYLYVTDGGHYDNTGLVEALRRRAQTIYVLDASNDAEDAFSAIGRAIATARMDLDCDVDLDPRTMLREEERRAAASWCVGRVTYADGGTGTVHVVKAIMLDKLPWDLEAYSLENPTLPRTSTLDQMYSEFDFEAYRALGHDAVTKLLTRPEAQPPVAPT